MNGPFVVFLVPPPNDPPFSPPSDTGGGFARFLDCY